MKNLIATKSDNYLLKLFETSKLMILVREIEGNVRQSSRCVFSVISHKELYPLRESSASIRRERK